MKAKKIRSWAILTLSFFGIFTVYLLDSSIGHTSSSEDKPTRSNSFPNLTCEQGVRLADWVKAKSRHAGNVELVSRSFVRKALQAYLEKLDPYRVLFTEIEFQRFQKEAEKPWRRWLKEKNCEFFAQWTESNFVKVRTRIMTYVSEVEWQKAVDNSGKKVALVKAEDESAELKPKHVVFAADEKELRERWRDWGNQIIRNATEFTRQAYGGDSKRLLADTITQLLFEEEVEASSILAKAVLATIDPYSSYFSPQEFEDFYQELSGGAAGIGIKIRKVPLGLLIEKIVSDSPAGKSKVLKPGQIITAVNGKKVTGLTTIASKNLLKGADGERVTLEVLPTRISRPIRVTLTRKPFAFEESKVSHRMVAPPKKGLGPVAVITIPSFYGRGGMGHFNEERSSSEDLRAIVEELVSATQKPRAILLDLRGNPGGFLEEAVSMAGAFLGAKPVVEIVESDSRRVLKDEQSRALYQGPLVLLTDDESASASEVLAGALKDYQRAVLVGAGATYGKGSVQKLFHLDNELMRIGLSPLLGKGVVKLTTSIFYSPLGHTPANGGVKPHIPLPVLDQKENTEPRPALSDIPEEKPFLDEHSMAEVKKREAAFKPSLSALEELSRKRVESLKRQDLLLQEEGIEQWELSEAVAIANDLAALQAKTQSSPSVTLRPRRNLESPLGPKPQE